MTTSSSSAAAAAAYADVSHEGPKILYEDSVLKITENEIILYWYYFPSAASKRIRLDKIKSIRMEERSILSMKHWGMAADFDVWWNCDMRRGFGRGGKWAIIVDSGEWPKVGLAPGHGNREVVERVEGILREALSGEEWQ